MRLGDLRRVARSRVAVAAATTALLVAIVAVAQRAPRPATEPGAWPSDTTSTYHVEWRTRSSATMSIEGRAELGSDIQARGDLRVRSYGEKAGATTLGVRWAKLETASAVVMGHDIVPPDELLRQLERADALVSVDTSGRALDVRFSGATTPLARGIVRALVLELCAQMATAAGEGVVDTPLGQAEVTRTADGATVRTARSRYDSLEAFPDGVDPLASGLLEATGQVDLGADRSIRSVRSVENVSIDKASGPMEAFASKTELAASFVARAEEKLGAPPDYAASEPRAHRKDDEGFDRKASLERRAMGVTYDSLLADVRMAGALPKTGATAWLWHDSAYLELHPEDATTLLDHASRELDLNQKAAAFDIVVISGTSAAQKALESALRGWASNDERTYIALVQRVGYLRRPSLDTLAFVEAQHAANLGNDRGRATAYTLGALAAAAREDHEDRARAIVATLMGELAQASNAEDRAALVRGLGNAGFEGSVDAVVAQRSSTSEDVRAAVASALRKVDGERVVDALLELATDADRVVAATALVSLFRRTLDDAAWAKLHRAFDEGRVPADVHETLLSGLAAKRGESQEVTALLVAMVASPDVHTKVKQRAESVLRQDQP